MQVKQVTSIFDFEWWNRFQVVQFDILKHSGYCEANQFSRLRAQRFNYYHTPNSNIKQVSNLYIPEKLRI